MVCRVFEVRTDDFCLVQVDPAGFLYLQVLEDNVVGGKVEVVEEENRFHSDPSDKPAARFQSFLPDRHRHRDDRSVALRKLNKTFCGFDGGVMRQLGPQGLKFKSILEYSKYCLQQWCSFSMLLAPQSDALRRGAYRDFYPSHL